MVWGRSRAALWLLPKPKRAQRLGSTALYDSVPPHCVSWGPGDWPGEGRWREVTRGEVTPPYSCGKSRALLLPAALARRGVAPRPDGARLPAGFAGPLGFPSPPRGQTDYISQQAVRSGTFHFRERRRVPRLAEAAAARSGPGSAVRRWLPGARRAEPPGAGGRGRWDRGGLRTIGAMLNMWKVRELVDKAWVRRGLGGWGGGPGRFGRVPSAGPVLPPPPLVTWPLPLPRWGGCLTPIPCPDDPCPSSPLSLPAPGAGPVPPACLLARPGPSAGHRRLPGSLWPSHYGRLPSRPCWAPRGLSRSRRVVFPL